MARRQFSRGIRRKTQWAGFGDSTGAAELPEIVSVPAATPSAIISFNAVIQNTLGWLDEEVTITRMIGMVTVTLNLDTALASASFAVGCLVARGEAITAGIGSLPSPEDDPDVEWLYYVSGIVHNPQNALRDGPLSGIHIPFDVKSQRIVRAGQSPVWIAHAEGNNLLVGVNGRYLAKLA